jgi:hypothetical protein
MATLPDYFQSHIGCPTGGIKHSGPRVQMQGGYQRPAPVNILAKAKQPVQEVVVGGDAIEHQAHKIKFISFH